MNIPQTTLLEWARRLSHDIANAYDVANEMRVVAFAQPIVPAKAAQPAPTVCKPTLTDALCEARVALEHVMSLNDLHYTESVETYKLVETLRQLGAFVDGD